MKGWLPMVLGLLALVLGAVWTLQGLNVLEDSSMSGVKAFTVIGPVLAVVGLVLIVIGFRIRSRSKQPQA
jgi:uncharacterized membrane protein HdeD (DUF308 family)